MYQSKIEFFKCSMKKTNEPKCLSTQSSIVFRENLLWFTAVKTSVN